MPCEGFCSRQVTCKRTRANGTVQALPPRVCILRDRPLGRRPCSSHPCVQGLFEQGNQVMLTNLVFKNHPVPVVKPTYPKRDFPWQSSVRNLPSNAEDAGSFPGKGAKIPHATRSKHQNIKQKQCSNKTPPIRAPSHRGEESTQLLQDIQETHLHRELTTLHTVWFRGLTILS